MASFVGAALDGLRADIAAGNGASEKLARLGAGGGALLRELVGMVALAPFGVRAILTQRMTYPLEEPPYDAKGVRRPSASRDGTQGGGIGVLLQREISYGPGAANLLDVYMPASAARGAAGGSECRPAAPVVCFVHGGVWASGERWHYAPMAVRLAQEGCVVIVPTYTLYPSALAGAMVGEVSAALSWTFDHVARYGGDPAQVSLVGHSAGGHLCALALMHRAMAADQQQQAGQQAGHQADSNGTNGLHSSSNGTAAPPSPPAPPTVHGLPITDTRMPRRFVGMSAIYDVAKHFDFEAARGVSQISMMARAMGGRAAFAAMSPRIALDDAADAAAHGGGGAGGGAASPLAVPRFATAFRSRSAASGGADGDGFDGADGPGAPRPAAPSPTLQRVLADDPSSFYGAYRLAGEAIPSRAGLDLTTAPVLGATAATAGGNGAAAAAATAGGVHHFPLSAAAFLPPFTVMGSCADLLVPWHEGAQMAGALLRCGVPVKQLIYNHVLHGDFIMAWSLRSLWDAPDAGLRRPSGGSGGAGVGRAASMEGLPGSSRDLVRIVTGEVEVHYVVGPAAAAAVGSGDGGGGGRDRVGGEVGAAVRELSRL